MACPIVPPAPAFTAWLAPLLVGFSPRSRAAVAALATGALLAIGPRTVTNCLRALGFDHRPDFGTFHRLLNRNAWSGLTPARALLHALVATFVPEGPIILAIDHTLERRRGPKLRLAAYFYDAVRSSRTRTTKSRGLRWLSAMLLAPVPFARTVWALPVLTLLASRQRPDGRPNPPVTVLAGRLLRLLRRWLPGRPVVAVMDGEFATTPLLDSLRPSMTVISRLRLNARLFDPPPERGGPGRRPTKGARQLTPAARIADPATVWHRAVRCCRAQWRSGNWIEYAHGVALWHHPGNPPVPIRWVIVRHPRRRRAPEAFLSTDLAVAPRTILAWFDRRWAAEVTYEELNTHLGVRGLRQWSDPAVLRTVPLLFALYSVVALYVHQNTDPAQAAPRRAAWYPKPAPSFVDALACLRSHLWKQTYFATCPEPTKPSIITDPLVQRLICLACYAP